jgi:solute carrier family 25 folate transporter 32
LKEEGITGFWKGLIPSLVGVSQGALQFTIYDTLKYQIRGDSHRGKLEIYEYIIMSCTSKIISTLITYPCQLLRSRLQDYSSINEKKTVRQVVQNVYNLEGIGGFYKGVLPNIVRVLPATCITFSIYETIKKIA